MVDTTLCFSCCRRKKTVLGWPGVMIWAGGTMAVLYLSLPNQQGSSVEMYTLPMSLSTFGTKFYFQSALVNKTWPKFISKKLGQILFFWSLVGVY